MDIASERARRKNRSTTNLSHLSLAPLTSKLPIDSTDATLPSNLFTQSQPTSYLQGKSAPTTPRLLSHSPAATRSRSRHRRTPSAPSTNVANLTKSKSSSQIAHGHHGPRKSATGTMTPGRRKEPTALGPDDRSDSDWLLRTAATMSTEARESKGQAWLVSRQSSTSLAAMRDPDEEAFEAELQRERELASRRGSSAFAEDEFATPIGSRYQSRVHSRAHSRAGTHSRLLSPVERMEDHGDSYFPRHEDDGAALSGPDFVNLDERLEALDADSSQDDEAAVRRLVRRGQQGTGSWFWSFLPVQEKDEHDDERSEDEGSVVTGSGNSLDETITPTGRSGWSGRHFEGVSNVPDERMPPPKKDEGGWQDAAWLLSVASKVMF